MKVTAIKTNKANPRLIRDAKFKKLINSIKDFPKMMALRPIVVDKDGTILGGNMRYKAILELGYKEIPDEWVKTASELTDEEKQRFIIEDNVAFGEWDFDMLANEWDADFLSDWGVDLVTDWANNEENNETNEENIYTTKIENVVYEPNGEKPQVNELYNSTFTDKLVEEIKKADIPDDIRKFLTIAASRHTVFNYEKIADFYANSNKEIQSLFENSALVIIDFNKAVEDGFVTLTDNFSKQFKDEYGNEYNDVDYEDID